MIYFRIVHLLDGLEDDLLPFQLYLLENDDVLGYSYKIHTRYRFLIYLF